MNKYLSKKERSVLATFLVAGGLAVVGRHMLEPYIGSAWGVKR